MDGIGGENRHGLVELLIHPFLDPPFASSFMPEKLSRFVGRKGWGTHGIVRDSKAPYFRLINLLSKNVRTCSSVSLSAMYYFALDSCYGIR